MPLADHPTGNYRFLPGIAPYSCGVVASHGFEIVHVTLQQPIPYPQGFEKIAEFLAAKGRPKAALCAIELRSPRPFSFQGFADFNAEYADILRGWGLFVDGVNPVARTNVAPAINPPSEPSLYGFSFTRACSSQGPPTFVIAGAGELPEGFLSREHIVALGDTSSWFEDQSSVRDGLDGIPIARSRRGLVASEHHQCLHRSFADTVVAGDHLEPHRPRDHSRHDLALQPTADHRDRIRNGHARHSHRTPLPVIDRRSPRRLCTSRLEVAHPTVVSSRSSIGTVVRASFLEVHPVRYDAF